MLILKTLHLIYVHPFTGDLNLINKPDDNDTSLIQTKNEFENNAGN